MYLLFYLLGVNSLSCKTSMQHIVIAHAIKSLLGLYTGHDSLGEKRGRLGWRTFDNNDIHELHHKTFCGYNLLMLSRPDPLPF